MRIVLLLLASLGMLAQPGLVIMGQMGGAAPGKEGRNLDHFCLRVEPFDEDAIRRHLARHGIDAGELKSRYGAEGQGPSFYINDPEGNVVELKGPPAS